MKYLAALFLAFSFFFSAKAQTYNFFIYAGQTTTIGTNDGVGTNILFNHPRGITLDPSGNIFVADTYNASIRRIGADGSSSTVSSFTLLPPPWGPQPAIISMQNFTAPENVAEDYQSNLYVLDNNLIYELKVTNPLSQNGTNYIPGSNYFASGFNLAGWPGTEYNHPHGMGTDSSRIVYLADQGNNDIRAATQTGLDFILNGSGLLNQPGGIVIDEPTSNYYVFSPYGLAVDQSNNIFITDGNGNIIKITASPYTNIIQWSPSSLATMVPMAEAIACDQSGNVYVAAGNILYTNNVHNVLRLDPYANITVLGDLPTAGFISGIAVDQWNNIYLSDQDNSVIIKGTPVYPAFFNDANQISGGEYELQFTNGTPFGFYYPQNFPYVYHVDMGWEYFVDANDGQGGAYLYDFSSGDWWYTSPRLFPYLYDFSLNAWLYYFPDETQASHYTTNPRYFYNFGASAIITR
jgi:NHL repeat